MITVENLTFSYQKQKQTLHGLTFSVADGEIFGFLGPNGSGKSTTQKILTGILRGYGGSTCLFGEPLENQQKNFQEKIGVLFEFPYLYTNLSALDNLNYSCLCAGCLFVKWQRRDSVKGLRYQLKNIRRDKMCILSFLLPILVGLAINLLSGVSFSSLGETAFCILENDLSDSTVEWLQTNGSVTMLPDMASLKNAVNDPATQAIGVMQDGNGIKTLLSGDELQVNKVIGNTLPQIYAEREMAALSKVTITPNADNSDALKSLLIVITMVTAMFMGCTFNAMSIIGEKEDGIAIINEVLPMTKKEYIVQKITLGFVGSVLSTLLTALVCMKITISQALPLLLLIVLSAFVAALVGLFIGRFSNGLMVGIVYIKIVMILFLAPPILFYLLIPADSILHALSYLLPPSATFYGLMDLLSGATQGIGINLVALSAHCLVWLLLFFVVEHGKHKKVFA